MLILGGSGGTGIRFVENGLGGGDGGGGTINDLHPLNPVALLGGNMEKLVELVGFLLQIVAMINILHRCRSGDFVELRGLSVSVHRLLPHIKVRRGGARRHSHSHSDPLSSVSRLLATEKVRRSGGCNGGADSEIHGEDCRTTK